MNTLVFYSARPHLTLGSHLSRYFVLFFAASRSDVDESSYHRLMNYAPNNLRPVQINFALYIDSDDAEFKLELIFLMISAVQELKSASGHAWSDHDITSYNASTHKTKSAVTLLDDSEFNHAIEEVRIQLSSDSAESQTHVLNHLHELCDSIILSLEHQAALLKAQL